MKELKTENNTVHSIEHNKLMQNNYKKTQAPASSRLLNSEEDKVGNFFVDVRWLKKQIDLKNPNLVLIDVTRGAGDYKLDATRISSDYAKAHIPTAVHLNTDELGDFKDYFKPAYDLKKVFLSKGINNDKIIVFYSIYARDIMYIASRMAFACYYLGLDNVKILDGGMQSWSRAGYKFESGINTPKIETSLGTNIHPKTDILISTPDDMLNALKRNPGSILASVRTWNEFTGKNQGHNWNKGVGEIYGAVYAGDELLTNVNGEMTNPDYYIESFNSWGINKDKKIILYCGTSWRSSTMFFLMKHLGWKNIKMFDGSWFKWKQAHEKNPSKYPIQIGDPRYEENFTVKNN